MCSFGSFHIELSFFSSLGRIIEGSGGRYVLSVSSIIAMRSMNKFLKGKMYNRCRRDNILLSNAMHGLHFQKFFENNSIQNDDIVSELEDWATNETEANPSDELNLLVEKYQVFLENTMAGNHGKTAKFWMIYACLMDLLLHRAMETNDVSLFAHTHFQICSALQITTVMLGGWCNTHWS